MTELAPLLVDSKAAASMLGIGKTTLYQNLASGRIKLPIIYIGRKRLFSVESVKTFVQQETTKNG